MLRRLTEREEWKFFSVLPRASPGLAAAWWVGLLLLGVLPAAFAVAMGILIGAVRSRPLADRATRVRRRHLSSSSGAESDPPRGEHEPRRPHRRMALRPADEACVRPAGIAHLEDASLATDLTVARDFDLGMTGPPLSIAMDFIAERHDCDRRRGSPPPSSLRFTTGGPSAILAGAWLATHYLLRESGVWYDRNTPEVRAAQRDADYAYRLAVDPPAGKELRLFGLGGMDARSVRRSAARGCMNCNMRPTRMRERPLAASICCACARTWFVFWSISSAAVGAQIGLGEAVACSAERGGCFGHRIRRPELGARWRGGPVAAVLRLREATERAGQTSTSAERRQRAGPRPRSVCAM